MEPMREMKRRGDSIASTRQITKAMKLVATVKLQKARKKAEAGRPYAAFVSQVVQSILSRSPKMAHPYCDRRDSGAYAAIVITSNRGLAGGYHSNVIKQITQSHLPKDQVQVYAIGKKGRDALAGLGYGIAADYSQVIREPLYQDAVEIGNRILKEYQSGQIRAADLFYTSFQNAVIQIPSVIPLLPVQAMLQETPGKPRMLMNYEPDEETVLQAVIPNYMASLIYEALLESLASENGARMTAMDAAAGNAQEMMEELALFYNRARQGIITRELTEITAGVQAVR